MMGGTDTTSKPSIADRPKPPVPPKPLSVLAQEIITPPGIPEMLVTPPDQSDTDQGSHSSQSILHRPLGYSLVSGEGVEINDGEDPQSQRSQKVSSFSSSAAVEEIEDKHIEQKQSFPAIISDEVSSTKISEEPPITQSIKEEVGYKRSEEPESFILRLIRSVKSTVHTQEGKEVTENMKIEETPVLSHKDVIQPVPEPVSEEKYNDNLQGVIHRPLVLNAPVAQEEILTEGDNKEEDIQSTVQRPLVIRQEIVPDDSRSHTNDATEDEAMKSTDEKISEGTIKLTEVSLTDEQTPEQPLTSSEGINEAKPVETAKSRGCPFKPDCKNVFNLCKHGHPTFERKDSGTAESSDEACCAGLATLICNKAVELITPHIQSSPALSKPVPPHKPPKPTAEALARARAVAASRIAENRPRSFGEDIPVGENGMRYADDDTESSTDYKDLDHGSLFIDEPPHYGLSEKYIVHSSTPQKQVEPQTDQSYVSDVSSYHTADTVTLKDEDNTFESASLCSDDDVFFRPMSLTPDGTTENGVHVAFSVDKKENLEKEKKGILKGITSPFSLFSSKKDKTQTSVTSTTLKKSQQKQTIKKPRPPLPPKPAVLLKSPNIPENSSSLQTDSVKSYSSTQSRFISQETTGIKHRPLTINLPKEPEPLYIEMEQPPSDMIISEPVSSQEKKLPPERPPPPLNISFAKEEIVPSVFPSSSLKMETLVPQSRSPQSIYFGTPCHAQSTPPPPPPRPPPPIHVRKTIVPPPITVNYQNVGISVIQEKSSMEISSPDTEVSTSCTLDKTPTSSILHEQSLMSTTASATTEGAFMGDAHEPPLQVEKQINLSISCTSDISESSTQTITPVSVIGADESLPSITDIPGAATHLESHQVDFSDSLISSYALGTPPFLEGDVTPSSDIRPLMLSTPQPLHSVPLTEKLNLDAELKSFGKCAQEPLPPPRSLHRKPKPPPRIRRVRSRTVEVVPLTWLKEELPRRRSHSLTESDIRKKLEEREILPLKSLEVKSLYTSVQKDSSKSKLKVDEQEEHDKDNSLEKMKFRPLPPPPPPPRSRSKSSSLTRRKEKEIPFQAGIAEKEAENKDVFFEKEIGSDDSKERHIKQIETKSEIPDNTEPEIRPTARRRKKQIVPPVDENANIAETLPQEVKPSSTSPTQKLISSNEKISSPVIHTKVQSAVKEGKLEGKSQSPSRAHRSKSASPSRKSRSSWYDESDISGDLGDVESSVSSSQKESFEKLDVSMQGEHKASQSPVQKTKLIKTKSDSKKQARSSTFYCDLGETGATQNVTAFNRKEEQKRHEKEPSPVLLDKAEKSVQTSLETLKQDLPSKDEPQSDDTDELLTIAHNLQKELSVIIKRHISLHDEETSEEDSHGRYSRGTISPYSPKLNIHSPIEHSESPLETKKTLLDDPSTFSQMTLQESSSDYYEEEEEFKMTSEELAKQKKKKKVYYIAKEIVASEESFVNVLKLLNEDFRAAVMEANEERGSSVIPEEVLNQILNNFPQLLNLNENLLIELKERIDNWEESYKIADVIVKIGPFLKLYSWYIQDFPTASSTLEDACRKYPAFNQVVKEFEMSPKCHKLALIHYMLKPVQRIPQYRLLLQKYLDNLPNDSPDYEDTRLALHIVSDVADHANNSMSQGDNFQKLVSIQNSILGNKEIIQPGRVFLKEGELHKLSRKGMQSRWFILFSDVLLYLTPVQNDMYRINHELPLTGMRVDIPVQEDYQNEFSIISTTRSFSLSASSREERSEWILMLNNAIKENASKRSTFANARLQQSEYVAKSESEGFVLGKQAPVWIQDARVTMCQVCTSEFTLTYRRHHCRACGKVVCSDCSTNKAPLHYLQSKFARVCDECFPKLMEELEAEEKVLGQESSGYTESADTDSDTYHTRFPPKVHRGRGSFKTQTKKIAKRLLPNRLKEVCANDQGSTISGYLHKKSKRVWRRFWFVLKDKVLYTYKASEDVAALESIPLLGFSVETFTEFQDGVDPGILFQLTHQGHPSVLFRAETIGSAERWIQAMKGATIL